MTTKTITLLIGDVAGPETNTDLCIPQWDGNNSKKIKNGLTLSTSAELGDSDSIIPTQKAVKGYVDNNASGGSSGVKIVEINVIDFTTDLSVGDGKSYFVVPDEFDGMRLTRVAATVITPGSD